jgi:hypothetical protein
LLHHTFKDGTVAEHVLGLESDVLLDSEGYALVPAGLKVVYVLLKLVGKGGGRGGRERKEKGGEEGEGREEEGGDGRG